MKNILMIFKREDNCWSLMRLMIFTTFLEFLTLSPIVVLKCLISPGYLVFAICMLVLVFAGLKNKNIEMTEKSLKIEDKKSEEK